VTKAELTQLVRETYEMWNGAGSWDHTSNWRKSDWRKLMVYVLRHCDTHHSRPMLPSEIPMPPQPFRPLRADATDENPEY
jgi:hypothetical protein